MSSHHSQQERGPAVVTASVALVPTTPGQQSPPLSPTNTHANNAKLREASAQAHSRDQADVSCSAKVALQSLQIQNIWFFSPTALILPVFFEVISLICLLERAGGELLASVLNIPLP